MTIVVIIDMFYNSYQLFDGHSRNNALDKMKSFQQ